MKIFLLSLIFIITLLISGCELGALYSEEEFMKLGEKEKVAGGNIAIAVPLESASNFINGAGTFHNPAIWLSKNTGERLNLSKVDYIENESLIAIYDEKNEGAFDVGKYFRVVYEGKNVNSNTGLSLTPIAKDLTAIVSPSSGQIYIDPKNGKFVLPRPVYWSKCESLDNFTTKPEIGDHFQATLTNAPSYSWTTSSGVKFNNCLYGLTGANQSISAILSPFYNTKAINKGAISFWGYLSIWGGGYNDGIIDIYLSSNIYVRFSYIEGVNNGIIQIYVNGTLESSLDFNWQSELHHISIIWDGTKGLSDSKSIRVFLDSTELLISYTAFNSYNPYIYWYTYSVTGRASVIVIDNIKVWKEALDPDAVKAMSNIEDSLHHIYGAANGYKPSSDIKVGYYYY